MIELLAKRFDVVKSIGKIKELEELSTFQLERWKSVLNIILEKGSISGIDQNFLKQIWQLIHKESIRLQGTKENPEL